MTDWRPKLVQNDQDGLPDLNAAPVQKAEQKGSDPWMYYARRANHPTEPGWIYTKDANSHHRAKYMKVGWVPLDQFGTFIYGQLGNDAIVDTNGNIFDSSRENYRVFFQNGGAAHMPVDQVISYGWHRRPPYRQVTFPQLEGLTIPDFQCLECTHAPFVATAHLRTHLMQTHGYSRTELNVYAQDAGLTWERRVAEHEKASAKVPEAVADLTPTDPVPLTCDVCDWTTPQGKKPIPSLRMHKRKHIESPVLVGEGAS
jgi:hypothetical protein